jgi:hypothetical protein
MFKSREARNRILSYLGLTVLVLLAVVVVTIDVGTAGWHAQITFPKLGGAK